MTIEIKEYDDDGGSNEANNSDYGRDNDDSDNNVDDGF